MVAICPGMAWSAGLPDAEGVLRRRFDGSLLQPRNNANWSLFDDQAINSEMERARLVDASARSKAWGNIDTLVTSQAPIIFWLWDRSARIRSQNVDGVIDRFTARWSLTYTALRDPAPENKRVAGVAARGRWSGRLGGWTLRGTRRRP